MNHGWCESCDKRARLFRKGTRWLCAVCLGREL